MIWNEKEKFPKEFGLESKKTNTTKKIKTARCEGKNFKLFLGNDHELLL